MSAFGRITILRTISPVALLILGALGATMPARARTTIVPDDFPTIQAAVDNLAEWAPVETLLVRGGSYPERVTMRHRNFVVRGIPSLDGSDRVPEIGGLFVGGEGERFVLIGLHFTGNVTASSVGPDHFYFADCRFDGGFSSGYPSDGREADSITLTRCTLYESVSINAWVGALDSSIVYGPVIIGTHRSRVADNRFENVPGRALLVLYRNALVARNRVRGGDNAFEAYPEDGDVRFEDNDIEGCRGWGIYSEGNDEGTYLERNRIAHCGGFGMKAVGAVVARNNRVLDCRGPGIDVSQQHGLGVVEGNVVGRCGLAGIRLTKGESGWMPATIGVRENTVYGCSGPGISISNAPGSTIANNLVYACGGLSESDSDPLLIIHNNWFPALDPPRSPSDLSVDPQFCDLAADDARLRSDSPLLDVPGAGKIGALGQGCEAPVVAIGFEMWPRVLQPASRSRWVTALVEPPSPFSVAEIDLASVRLNDVPVAAGTEATVGDRDRDGLPDLQLQFDRAAIERTLVAGEAVTVTATGRIGRRNFAGTDVIRVLRYSGGPHPSVPRPAPRVLSIQAPPALGAHGIRVSFALVDESPAHLEMLDVAGRVVLEREVGGREPGEHALDLGHEGLAQGIYFLRLRQGMSEARTRVVVVR